MSTRTAAASPTRSSPTTSWRRRSSTGTRRKSEYPNLVLIAVWDQRSQEQLGERRIRPLHRAEGHRRRPCHQGRDVRRRSPQTSTKRLKQYASDTGGLKLSADFAEESRGERQALQRLRAQTGKDLDFQRGERQVELLFNGPTGAKTGSANPTMYPISGEGPYYAALLTGGNLDTKGGPATNADGQVLERRRQAHPGPLRRRQLRRLGIGARLLGRRRDARTDHGLRLSRGKRGASRKCEIGGEKAACSIDLGGMGRWH